MINQNINRVAKSSCNLISALKNLGLFQVESEDRICCRRLLAFGPRQPYFLLHWQILDLEIQFVQDSEQSAHSRRYGEHEILNL